MTWKSIDPTSTVTPENRTKTAELPPIFFPLREPELPPMRVGPLLVGLLLGGFVGASSALALQLRTVGVAALTLLVATVGVIVVVALARRARRAAQRLAALAPRIALDSSSLTLVEGEAQRGMLRIDRPFGLTLLATPARDVLVLALTHRDGVAFVAGRAPSGSHRTELLARAITTPANDLPLEGGVPTFACGDRLLDLAVELEARAPGAFERLYLSDAGMADVVLDGRRLRAGHLDFDLRTPTRWRAYSFQEGSTFAANSYQATQLRQGDREVVLVALSPSGELATSSLVSPPPGTTRVGPLGFEAVQRALARDLRLAHCLADMPPPRAQRVAVDRLFMPRIRLALDLAPNVEDRIITPSRGVGAPPPAIAAEHLHTPPEGIELLRSSRP